MKFIPVFRYSQPEAIKIFKAYCLAFPPEERRNERQYSALFDTGEAEVLLIEHDNTQIGYLIIWKLSHYIYIEHFEVFPEFRSKKYGSLILEEFQKIHPGIVLESEPENKNEVAERRIRFYERNGFKIIDRDYIQPSYGEEKESVHLYLLSTKPADAADIAREIHRLVYGVTLPDTPDGL